MPDNQMPDGSPAESGARSQADAHLRALLRYTESFYGTAIQHGMKAAYTADSIAHIERAGKALHQLVHTWADVASSRAAQPALQVSQSRSEDLLRELRQALWSEHITGLPLLQDKRNALIARIDEVLASGRTPGALQPAAWVDGAALRWLADPARSPNAYTQTTLNKQDPEGTRTPLYELPDGFLFAELTDEDIQRLDDETMFHESPDWALRFARKVLAAAGGASAEAARYRWLKLFMTQACKDDPQLGTFVNLSFMQPGTDDLDAAIDARRGVALAAPVAAQARTKDQTERRVQYLLANPDELRNFVRAAEQNADDFIALNREMSEARAQREPGASDAQLTQRWNDLGREHPEFSWADRVRAMVREFAPGAAGNDCNFPDCSCDGPKDERCRKNRNQGGAA